MITRSSRLYMKNELPAGTQERKEWWLEELN